MHLNKLNHQFGRSIDCTGAELLCAENVTRITTALKEDGLLILSGVDLSLEQYLKFGKNFGRIRAFCEKKYQHPDHPEIFVVSNRKTSKTKMGMDRVGYYWHSDSSFLQDPLPFTMLYSQVVPDMGGETAFIDMSEAYATLPQDLKTKIFDAKALHEGKYKYIITEEDLGLSLDEIIGRDEESFPAPTHPLVIQHPYNKRRCLYLSEGISNSIQGLTRLESEDLLFALWEHIKSSCVIYTHRWKMNQIIIWDNRRMIHQAYPALNDSPRMMFRLGIEDGPFFKSMS